MFGLGTRWDRTEQFRSTFLGWDDPICAWLRGWGCPCSVFGRRDGERKDGWMDCFGSVGYRQRGPQI